ncbi:uncharacterized protein LOC135463543 [Liolophura sinensis]|uniref:uncharacterized protein LOC135463543 n=1 Tax=Liolophura sinensis TaxID=3198878 RepID=UPI003158823D
MASCLAVMGIIWLVITNLAIIICFSTPFWMEDYMINLINNEGLWAKCGISSCVWFFEDDFALEETKPVWFKAVQALVAVGLGCGLLALLFATCSLCCETKRCNLSAAISTVLILAFLCIGIAIIVYGAKANSEYGVNIGLKMNMGRKFGWSFWLGVVSAALILLTSTMYACDCKRRPGV